MLIATEKKRRMAAYRKTGSDKEAAKLLGISNTQMWQFRMMHGLKAKGTRGPKPKK